MNKETLVSREAVENVLEALRPYLQADGGDVELVGITEEGTVQLRMHGACGGCPSSTYTLKMGIETRLKEMVPGVREVEQVF
ncbi:MAG: NifU family protein [Cyanobacteria bacterium NC_groundwater_1444_Ag_S-0.65um_54_12]|nr:NifU family protein [Cyanobacteria bacterium NC_groundwater_1444_Ag_S-0.65um_54_12]